MLHNIALKRAAALLAVAGLFSWVNLFMIVPIADAKGVNVVVMDCGETDADTFRVDDISVTEDVGVSIGDDCALALQTLLGGGYKIVPGGGGGIFDSDLSNEHVLYTLVKRGFRFSPKVTPHTFNFPSP